MGTNGRRPKLTEPAVVTCSVGAARGLTSVRVVPMVKSYIINSPAGCEIVTKPYLVGAELESLALQSSKDFITSLDGAADFEKPVSLEILNG